MLHSLALFVLAFQPSLAARGGVTRHVRMILRSSSTNTFITTILGRLTLSTLSLVCSRLRPSGYPVWPKPSRNGLPVCPAMAYQPVAPICKKRL